MEEVITPQTLPDGSQLNPADGGGADQTGSISLDQLSEVLGKDFKDVDGALKSIKDTYGYVGSQAQYTEKIGALAASLGTDEAGVLSTIETLMEEINNGNGGGNDAPVVVPQDGGQYVTKEDLFFMNNKEISDLRDVLIPLKNASDETRDMPWESFVASETAKKVIDPIIGYREVQNRNSILDSSPRLGSAVDKVAQARQLAGEAVKAEQAGDIAGARRAQDAADAGAVASVIEAYGLGE
jgi:hypothetical protein